MGTDDAAAPTLNERDGRDDAPGTYHVEITYVTAKGESMPSAPADVTLTAPQRRRQRLRPAAAPLRRRLL